MLTLELPTLWWCRYCDTPEPENLGTLINVRPAESFRSFAVLTDALEEEEKLK